jgi:hypothetical protein
MLKYTKKKQGINGEITGHYYGDTNEMANAIRPSLKIIGATCNTEDPTIIVQSIIQSEPFGLAELDKEAIDAIVSEYGTMEMVIQRAKDKRKTDVNNAIVSKIRETYSENEEMKLLRLRDEDFDTYNARVEDLRTQGRVIKAEIDAITLKEDPTINELNACVDSIAIYPIVLT